MRPSTMLLCVVALAACAKTEDKAADTTTPAAAAPAPAPAALSLADVAGTWDGTVKPMDKDTTVATVTLTATGTNDGWTMVLNGQTVPLTVASVAGDSVVTTASQFKSAVKKGRTVKSLQSILHFQSGKLTGVTHATYDNGDTASYRTDYTKK